MTIKALVDSLSSNQKIELLIALGEENIGELKQELESKFAQQRQDFDDIVNKRVRHFGIPDLMDMFDAYFPCKFVSVADEERMLLNLYEPSIDRVHNNVFVGGLHVERRKKSEG